MFEQKDLKLKILGLVTELKTLESKVTYEEFSSVKKEIRYHFKDQIPVHTVLKMFNDHGIEL